MDGISKVQRLCGMSLLNAGAHHFLIQCSLSIPIPGPTQVLEIQGAQDRKFPFKNEQSIWEATDHFSDRAENKESNTGKNKRAIRESAG